MRALLHPNSFHYSALLSACGKGKQWQLGLAIFHQSPATAAVYNATMSCLERAQQWQRALELYDPKLLEDLRTSNVARASKQLATGHLLAVLRAPMSSKSLFFAAFHYVSEALKAWQAAPWPYTLHFFHQMRAHDLATCLEDGFHLAAASSEP